MDPQSFDEFQDQIQVLYQEEEYQAALNLVNELFDEFPAQRPLLYYWRMTLSALLGEIPQALGFLDHALEEGLWFSEEFLRNLPSLQELQRQEAFDQLIALNRELEEKDQQGSFPLLTLRPQDQCQKESDPCPLLIALHGNASNAQASVDLWQPAASTGWMVAIPQSPKAMWKGAYIWDDYHLAESHIKKHLVSLKDKYSIDLERLVLAGHSNGGEAAIWLSLTGLVKARGFIAVDPAGPMMTNPELLTALVQGIQSSDIGGAIILSQNLHPEQEESLVYLLEMLDQRDIPCYMQVLGERGTDFSSEYAQAISHALNSLAI